LAPRLPVAYRQFAELFKAIFIELAMLRVPEREGNPGIEAGIAPRLNWRWED
jgi:hypothetical protein